MAVKCLGVRLGPDQFETVSKACSIRGTEELRAPGFDADATRITVPVESDNGGPGVAGRPLKDDGSAVRSGLLDKTVETLG